MLEKIKIDDDDDDIYYGLLDVYDKLKINRRIGQYRYEKYDKYMLHTKNKKETYKGFDILIVKYGYYKCPIINKINLLKVIKHELENDNKCIVKVDKKHLLLLLEDLDINMNQLTKDTLLIFEFKNDLSIEQTCDKCDNCKLVDRYIIDDYIRLLNEIINNI